MATSLPHHLYGEQRYTKKRRGWDTRTGKVLVHLVASCHRCSAEKLIAQQRRNHVQITQ